MNSRVSVFKEELKMKSQEVMQLNKILNEKETTIRNISIAHTQFKQQLEEIKEELMVNKHEKEILARKLTLIEKGDKNNVVVQNESLKEQNQKLLQTLIKKLNNDSVK